MKGFENMPLQDGAVYVQCLLENHCGAKGYWRQQTSFIPEKFAHAGETLQLKQDGQWEDGWVVVHCYTKRINVPYVQKAIREHRKRTGDSLPKQPR